ncbi:hypothetical protein FQ142_08410 [Microbacterium sp. ANT_H45B]|nr:hypothetical protein FQ142_08410 [Microbacterium sp. ANT_H45B]
MRDAPLVPGVHRVIRRLDAGEGPFAGPLVVRGGSAAVLVDVGELGGWAGWAHVGDEHVAAPIDLARRFDGHDALLPWCTERVGALLARRVLAEAPLAAGEVTTMVASLLRGVGELVHSDDDVCTGEWWLTDDGRPLFVIGGGADACAATALLVEQLHKDCSDRALSRLLGQIVEGMRAVGGTAQMSTRRLERWETDLLDAAAPRPLQRSVQEPVRVRDLDTGRRVVAGPVTRREGRVVEAGRSLLPSAVRGTLVACASGAAGAASRGLRALGSRRGVTGAGGRSATPDAAKTPRRPDRPRARHLRAVAMAGVAASVVLAAGLLWPVGATQGQDDPAASPSAGEAAWAGEHGGERSSRPATPVAPDDDADPAEPRASAEPEGTAEPDVDPATSDDPVVAAPAVLAVFRGCLAASDAVCADAVAAGSAAAVSTFGKELGGTAIGDDDRLTFAPVDQYGDIAVVRVSSPAGTTQKAATGVREWMLVLVRVDEKWLVRDAYDVADQPG